MMRGSHPLSLVTAPLGTEEAGHRPSPQRLQSLNTCRDQRGAAHARVQHVGWFRRHIKNRANKTKYITPKAIDNLGAPSPPSGSASTDLMSQAASFPHPEPQGARLAGFAFQAGVGGLPGGDGPALSSGRSQLGAGHAPAASSPTGHGTEGQGEGDEKR